MIMMPLTLNDSCSWFRDGSGHGGGPVHDGPVPADPRLHRDHRGGAHQRARVPVRLALQLRLQQSAQLHVLYHD